MTFDCSWDSSVVLWTIGIGVLLLAAIIILAKKLVFNIKEQYYWVSVLYGLGVLFILFFTITTIIDVPINIQLNDNSLVVNRPATNIVIDYTAIKDIRRITKEDLEGETRTNGSTGFFGYQGKWKSKNLGNYKNILPIRRTRYGYKQLTIKNLYSVATRLIHSLVL